MNIRSKAELDQILDDLKDAEYQVAEVKNGERSKKAPLPFTTSTLQQEASQGIELFYPENHASGAAVV